MSLPPKQVICLYPNYVSNLDETNKLAEKWLYDVIIMSIGHSSFEYELTKDRPMFNRHMAFTRSDLIQSSSFWINHCILTLSERICCDSNNTRVQNNSELLLKQEIDWIKHLSTKAFFIYKLKDGDSLNSARCLSANIDETEALIQLPWFDVKKIAQNYRSTKTEEAHESPWHRWDQFRAYADFNHRFRIFLELTEQSPTEKELNRWFGEPIAMILIPSTFFRGANAELVSHKYIIRRFIELFHCNVAIKCSADDQNAPKYLQQIRELTDSTRSNICNEKIFLSNCPFRGVSESKCRKLKKNYFDAIYKLFELIQWNPKSNNNDPEPMKIMIFGPNIIQLISIVLDVRHQLGCSLKLIVFEENIHICNELTLEFGNLAKSDLITIIRHTDGNNHLKHQMNAIISFPLSSIYGPILMQQQIDRLKSFLRSDGVVIPSSASMSTMPIMSAKLIEFIRRVDVRLDQNKEKIFDYTRRYEMIYQFSTANSYRLCDSQEIFNFSIDLNTTNVNDVITVHFPIENDGTFAGFATSLAWQLFDDIEMKVNSIDEEYHFLPLKSPQQLKSGSKVTATFRWFHDIIEQRIWFEWSTQRPVITSTHNLNGISSKFKY